MSFLGFLHDYDTGDILSSSDWNDELNQLVALLGSGIVANTNASLFIKDQTDGSNNPVILLENLSTGDILELSNGTLTSLIKNNGQLQLGASGIVGLLVSSNVKCVNLNADFLQGKTSADLETKLFSFHSFQILVTTFDLENAIEQPVFVAVEDGLIITKLKGKQEGVASANASTIFGVFKNGISIGNITISGNTTAVQTNDIVDVPLVIGDVIKFQLITYSGTTKHIDVTLAFHYKNKYNV